jgi:hypothetical protein
MAWPAPRASQSVPTDGCSWPRSARSAWSPSILPPYPGGPPGLVPTGVTVGAGGTVYVSSDIRNALYKLTPPAP